MTFDNKCVMRRVNFKLYHVSRWLRGSAVNQCMKLSMVTLMKLNCLSFEIRNSSCRLRYSETRVCCYYRKVLHGDTSSGDSDEIWPGNTSTERLA
jgi:hypothetical protein